MTTRAIFFDVDFTLIRPGPAFQGSGYHAFCASHGVSVDPSRFDDAVSRAASLLHTAGDRYDPGIFVQYTMRIIEAMGGEGPAVETAARTIYDEWSACRHFELFEDVADTLREIAATGVRMGLISNTQRCLSTFAAHFALDGLFDVTVSSAAHGYMKPHPSIFESALAQAGVSAPEALMVGDSLAHDIVGARSLGMRAILVARSGRPPGCPPDVPHIETLRDLKALL